MTKEELLKLATYDKGSLVESISSSSIFDTVNISEDVKGSLVTVIDGAVKTMVESNLEKMADHLIESNQELIESEVNSRVQDIEATMVESINDFCVAMADKYIQENEVQVTKNIKAELFENLFGGMLNVLQSNNISIDETQVDVVDELMEELDEQREAIKHLTSAYTRATADLSEQRKLARVAELTEGLSENQKASIAEITEGLSYSDPNFDSIVQEVINLTINEDTSYFGGNDGNENLNENYSFNDGPSGDGLNYMSEDNDQGPVNPTSRYVL